MVIIAGAALFLAGCQGESREQALAEGARLMAAGNARGAMVIYKTLVERNPRDDQARYELTLVYLAFGKTKLAEKEAQRLSDSPSPPDRLSLLRGRVYLAAGRTEDALNALSAYKAKFPDSAEAWEYQGHAYAKAGRLPEAAAAYEHALSLSPRAMQAQMGLVRVRIDQERFGEARAAVDVLLAAHPDDYAGLRLLGQVQAQSGDFPGATATFGRIAAAYPNDIEARYNAAFYQLAGNGLTEGVESVARALIKAYPTRPEGYKLLGLVELTRGASSQAVSNFQHALRLRPETQLRYYLAQAYARDGRYEMAISELGIVLDEAPRYAKARQQLASLHLRMNRPDAAIDELEKVLRLYPDDAATKRMLGDIYLAKRQFDKSLGYYEAVSGDSEQVVAADLQKSRILNLRGQADQAEAVLRRAMAKARDNLEVRLALVAMLTRRPDAPGAALAVLDQPGLLPPNQAQALLAKAGILAGQGRTDDALAQLEQARVLDPSLTAPSHAAAAIFFSRNDAAKAVDQYRLLLVRDPHDPVAHAALADRLEEAGRPEEAREHLEQAAASGRCDDMLDLAAFYARQGNPQAGIAALGNPRAVCAGSLPALVATARLQTALGDEAQALAAIRKIEAVEPDTALAERFRLSMSLEHRQRATEEATKLLERQSVAADDMTRATSLVGEGDLSGARQSLGKALAKEPSEAVTQLGLTALLMKMGRTSEAADSFAALTATTSSQARPAASQNGAGWPDANRSGGVWGRETVWHRARSLPMVLNALALVAADDPQQAGKALQYAMVANALEGNNPFILDTLGYALLKNDRREDAIFILQSAALLAPKNQNIVEHLSKADVFK